jgi:hypothetical protein
VKAASLIINTPLLSSQCDTRLVICEDSPAFVTKIRAKSVPLVTANPTGPASTTAPRSTRSNFDFV